jgi:hypothetical protein
VLETGDRGDVDVDHVGRWESGTLTILDAGQAWAWRAEMLEIWYCSSFTRAGRAPIGPLGNVIEHQKKVVLAVEIEACVLSDRSVCAFRQELMPLPRRTRTLREFLGAETYTMVHQVCGVCSRVRLRRKRRILLGPA